MKKFVVIGAGILGASAAYHLAKSGAEVAIIDRHDKGQATDAAAGIIGPWLSQRRNKAWYALAKGGAAYYPMLIKELEEDGERDTGYQQVGAISLQTDELKLNRMEERAFQRLEDAPEIGEISRLTETGTRKLFPVLAEEFASVHITGAARVNGRKLRLALLNAARRHGAKVIHGDARLVRAEAGDESSDDLGKEKNIPIVVMAGETTFQADCILVTAGAWAPELLAHLGVELKIVPQKAQIAHLQLEGVETDNWPVVMPPGNQYIVAFEGGRVVIGATHEDGKGFDQRITAGGLYEVLDKALKVAPGLADATFIEARTGFRPVAPNFLPIIGHVPGFENLFLANGLGASGLTAGPFLGLQLAKLALGEGADIDLALYQVTEAIGKGYFPGNR
ncbi:FAD-binding oxidoreductase [Bacillus sp. REN3]|uniref:NAD(P)/FAD-dependent oxidoreductase n=1 Tax=Bacillus sp. REN3 TaxID=2802440 RepID=UPI001AED8B6B|nr:FAD-binding oxidoreductase [Bacillus sp. REN3]